MAKRNLNVAFKAYSQQQAMLLPPSLDELIKPNHPVRIVNQVLDRVDIDPLIRKYKGAAPAVSIPGCYLKYWCTLTSIIPIAAVK